MRRTIIWAGLFALACGDKDTVDDTGVPADDTEPTEDTATEDTGCDSPQVFYLDEDGDGFGGTKTVEACEQPAGSTLSSEDCDDADPAVNPDATEICDGKDNDCDDDADSDAVDMGTWYVDSDQDGYGDPEHSTRACDPPTGTADNDQDCDDEQAAAWTGAPELCDDIDNDCDGDTDEELATTTWYTDGDGDGFGDSSSGVDDCAQPSGTVDNGEDCDDANGDLHPDSNGECPLGADCQEVLDNGYTTDGQYLVDVDGLDAGESPFTVYCDQSEDDGGWTLLMSADGSSTYWGNNSPNWAATGSDAPPSSIDTNAADFHGAAYDLLETDEIKLCYQATSQCYVFEHNLGVSFFDFFDQGLTHVEYSGNSQNIADAGDVSAISDYLLELGSFTVHETNCQWLGINDTNSISSIGLLGDWNGGCANSGGTYPYHDDLALGIGLQSCYDANGCSNGGSGHAAGQTRGVMGVDDSGVYGSWHVFGR